METDQQKNARAALLRVEKEADGAQFGAGAPIKSDDPIEVWGTRIGRGLGLLITVFLLLAIIVWFGASLPS
ncbi:MAG: hypothetical protein WCC66_09055 [Rhizobiaceae bacterium]